MRSGAQEQVHVATMDVSDPAIPRGARIAPHPSPSAEPGDTRRIPPRLTATDILWLMVAILLSLALRIPFFNIPMIHDEGGYAYATRAWLEGTGQLYDDLWISRPQGIFILYELVFEFLGEGVWALRFTAWLFAAGTVHAVWLFARRWTAARIANLAAILSAILLSLPNLEGFTANAEIFMGLPLAWAAFWLVRQAQVQWNPRDLFWIGSLIGIATVLKPSGIVMLFSALAFILIAGPAERVIRLRLVGAMMGGTGVIGIATLLHGWYLGWDNFFYAAISYRLTLQSSMTVSMLHHLKGFGAMLWHTAALVALLYLIVALRRFLRGRRRSLTHRPRRGGRRIGTRLLAWMRQKRRKREAAGLMLQLWVIGAILGIAMGGDWWTHYLIQIVPPLALWLAWNLDRLAHALHRWQRGLFVTMATVLVLLPYAVIIDGPFELLNRFYDHPGYPAQAEVARYIQDNTDPDDTIYVAFDQAAIYYLSDRKPAYRHLYDQELQALPDSYADIISIIHSDDRPVYIVSTLHPGPFPDDSRAFWREVGQYYDIEIVIDGVPIYRAKDAP